MRKYIEEGKISQVSNNEYKREEHVRVLNEIKTAFPMMSLICIALNRVLQHGNLSELFKQEIEKKFKLVDSVFTK